MASLIKNQVLKHLSKFAKNLSPDKLQLSTLKGQGELHNLELNEQVLTDLLELPAWLRLTQATCNHVTLKIHWTKLKSVPIYLSLDEVLVEMETCEDLRPPTPQSNEPSSGSSGKYGFSDRVIDGMTLVVNSVLINFRSPAFQASFQLSRIVLESYSPDWKKKDLRLSRVKDPERGEILLFKRLEWQVLRIEAKSKDNLANGIKSEIPLTPLRLITNQACCKITIKKRLNDCSVVGSRLVFILDDLLWVLTDAQLVAALHFLQSLSGLVQKATQLTQKLKAKQKLEQQPDRHHQSGHSKTNVRLSPVFTRHDVVETSYHVLCSRIDLHLCDDMDPKDGRSQHPSLKGGGALQVSLYKLVVDYYPYHRAFDSRDHWLRYTEPSSSRSAWIQQLLSLFYDKLQTKSDALVPMDNMSNKVESPKHTSVHRVSSQSTFSSSLENTVASSSPVSPDDKPALVRKASTASSSNSEAITPDATRKNATGRKASLQWNYRYLMSTCFVLRLEDFVAYKVSTSTSSRKGAIEKFLIYNKSVHLPSDIKTVHLEITSYYLPGELDFPVPASNMFLHFGPLQLSLDTATILWLNAFHLNLQKCLLSMKYQTVEAQPPMSIRVEALMPQIVIPTDKKSPAQPDRPKSLQIQASRIIATNCRLGDHASRIHLNDCLEALSTDSMFFKTSQFPWNIDDKKPVSERFVQHVLESDSESVHQNIGSWSKKILSESCDVWSIHLDPCWADYTVCESGRTRLQAFIDPLPLTVWFYNSQKPQPSLDALNMKQEAVLDTNENKKMYLPELQPFLCQNSDSSSLPKLSKCEAVNSGNTSFCDDEIKSEADIYLLIHVHSVLNIQLTHYQYVFALRMSDILTDLLTQLSLDTCAILKDRPVLSVCVSAWWPKVEIALILRNLNQLSATSDSMDLASFQEDCSSNSDILLPQKKKMLPSQSSFSIGEYDNKSKQDQSGKLCSGVLDDCCVENGLPKSCSDSLLNCHSSISSQSPNTPVEVPSPEKTTDTLHKGIQSGTSAMKRGLCSLVASIDSALTKSDSHNHDSESMSFPDEDALSIRSDLSSDLDQFVMINQDGALDDEFFPHPVAESVEVATEMKEDTISNYTLNSEKKREMISVTTFKFGGLGFALQSKDSACLIMQCNHIETKEEAAISWENFQNNFSSRSRSWQIEKKELPKGECQFSLRLVTDSAAKIQHLSSEGAGFLNILASNLHLQLLMSSVSGLVDFFEDEITPKPIPSKIILDDLRIQLQEDRPPTSITSPNNVPLNINLPGCILERTLDGTLSVLPLPYGYIKNNTSSLMDHSSFKESYMGKANVTSGLFESIWNYHETTESSKQMFIGAEHISLDSPSCNRARCEVPSLDWLLAENERLRSKLVVMKGLQEENQTLKQKLHLLQNASDEKDLTKQLMESKNEIKRLEDEKRTLQETLRVLQKEVSRLDTERLNDSKK